MVKIDLAKCPSSYVIDLSTHALQKRFVGSRACDEQIQELLRTDPLENPFFLAMKYKEVLLCARGAIPSHFFELCDEEP